MAAVAADEEDKRTFEECDSQGLRESTEITSTCAGALGRRENKKSGPNGHSTVSGSGGSCAQGAPRPPGEGENRMSDGVDGVRGAPAK